MTGRAPLVTTVLLVAALAPPSALRGQDVAGEILGRVLDPAGQGLAGVVVTVTTAVAPGARTTATDAVGRFRLPRLRPGAYRVTLERLGYRSVVIPSVAVELGRTAALPTVTLPVRAVELPPLEVRIDRTLPDPTTTSLGATLGSSLLERLPSGREWTQAIRLLPQADESHLGDPVNVAGGTGLENRYHVEGVDVTDPYRGRRGTALPRNFVQAVELVRGGYEARYGGALGGTVNVVTRSGGDAWRVEAFGHVAGSGLSATPRSVEGVQARGPSSELDVGVSVGGPVVRERLRMFAAWNPTLVREEVALPGLPVEDAWITRHTFAAKVDWRASPAMDVTLSAFGDPSRERRVQPPSGGVRLENADPVLSSHRDGSVTLALRGVLTPRNGLLVEGSVAHHRTREDVEGATIVGRSTPTVTDRRNLPAILLSGGQRDDQDVDGARTSLALAAAWSRGSHRLEAGVGLDETRLGIRVDETPGQIFRHGDALWEAVWIHQDATVRGRVASVFLQDSWAMGSGVRLNAGVRWDGQRLTGGGGDARQDVPGRLQPRVGLIWQPGRREGLKVFAHAGRFEQPLALYWASLALAGFDQRQLYYSVDPLVSPSAVDSVRVLSEADVVRGGVEGLRGQYHDELVLGVEAHVGEVWVLGVAGTRRVLRSTVTSAYRPDGTFTGGNPGRPPLEHLATPRRAYTALEGRVERRGARLTLLAAYVLSRNRGDHPGLYAADAGGLRGGSYGPNNDQAAYFPAQRVNAFGPLPNDRPHVFKLAGAWELPRGLSVGSFLVAQSGTPLSELGRVPGGVNAPLFLAPRGSAGRGPAQWNLDLRVAWSPAARPGTRIVVDVLHVGNARTAVRFDQRRFNGARGSPLASWEQLAASQVGERPSYGDPVAFQPPVALRLGLEVGLGASGGPGR